MSQPPPFQNNKDNKNAIGPQHLRKIAQLKQLKTLFESKVLTQQEFEIEKSKILAEENGVHLLRFWHELYKEELITEAEFQTKKDGLLKKETEVEFITENETEHRKTDFDQLNVQDKPIAFSELNTINPIMAQSKKKSSIKIWIVLLIFCLLCIVAFLGYKTMQQNTDHPIVIDDSGEMNEEKFDQEGTSNTASFQDNLNKESNFFDEESHDYLSERLLSQPELSRYSASQLRLIRNEIFARHGLMFKSQDLIDYFNRRSWYRPMYRDVSNQLNSIEKQNIELIKSME